MTRTGDASKRLPLLAVIAALLAACAMRAPIEVVRGLPPIDRSVVASVSPDAFRAGRFTARDGTVLSYRMLAPERIEPGQRYPLVVQFHSSGGIGDDNRGQVEATAKAWALPEIRRRHPAFVLVPQFPVRSADYDDPVFPRRAQATPALAAAIELVEDVMASQPVDRRRVYATGFSMGGSAAWLAPTLRPGLFAAAVPMSGIAPERSQAGLLKDLPLLVLHGDADTENPIDADRGMVRAILALGGRNIRMRVYAGLGHQPPGDLIPGDAWRDWLFSQQRTDAAEQTHVRGR